MPFVRSADLTAMDPIDGTQVVVGDGLVRLTNADHRVFQARAELAPDDLGRPGRSLLITWPLQPVRADGTALNPAEAELIADQLAEACQALDLEAEFELGAGS